MRTEKLNYLAINKNGFVFDPSTGYSYNANETAVDILEHLISGMTPEAIVEKLASEYEVNHDELLSDVDYFVRVLENYNLVDKNNEY